MDSTPEQNTTDTFGSINKRAEESLQRAKDKLKLHLFRDAVLSENYPQREIDAERIQELLDHPDQNDRFKASDTVVNQKIEHNRAYVDEVFARVSGFGLPKELSLAVCYVISGVKTNSKNDLISAADIIDNYAYNDRRLNAKKDNS